MDGCEKYLRGENEQNLVTGHKRQGKDELRIFPGLLIQAAGWIAIP